ncbi:hypothetical protein IMSAGC021_01231 [Muribaculaceae bacterium]|nr:hypothetical protein IMSAGC021_01231 [Muribaculaceae bacterium]
MGVSQIEFCCDLRRCVFPAETHSPRLGFADHFSGGINQSGIDADISGFPGIADNVGADCHRRDTVCHVGVYLLSPERNVYFIERAEPDVAVDAATAIPARVWLFGVVDTHSYHVFAVSFEIRGEIIAERCVAVRTCAEFMSVDEDGGVHVGSVKVDERLFALLSRRDGE